MWCEVLLFIGSEIRLQIQMDKNNKEKTDFAKSNIMPFGLSNAPAKFKSNGHGASRTEVEFVESTASQDRAHMFIERQSSDKSKVMALCYTRKSVFDHVRSR